jgi:hypothetical protein
MAIDFFGFSFGNKSGKGPPGPEVISSGTSTSSKSFVPPDEDDGARLVTEVGGFYGTMIDLEGNYKSDASLIDQYRTMAMHAEVEMVIDDITNEAIVRGLNEPIVELNLANCNISESIKKKIEEEFKHVLRILNFNIRGHDIFRKWYIDSRLYYHIIPYDGNGSKGIKEIRPIDPTKIQKIRNITKKKDPNSGIDIIDKVEEFFFYTDKFATSMQNSIPYEQNGQEGVKIDPNAICYVPSGLFNHTSRRVFGYLHKAVKPLNQLRMIEDAVVIYRISRAPERRVFYIDVGSLPKNKAEQYLRDMMNRYRNKLVYDAATGEVRDDRKHMNMLEDFWLPRKEGGRGTEIDTLQGGENLGEMDDVEYFKKKLYQALNVPTSRLEAENGFNMGRSSEITRDELKFHKFIQRLQLKFSELFLHLLKTQLILKSIIKEDDWNKDILHDIEIVFNKDSYFTELKENEILKERIELLRDMDEYVGKYYSVDTVRRNILKQSEEDIRKEDKQMKKEEGAGLYDDEDSEEDNNFGNSDQ